jgi:hypothetical protein
MAQAMTTSKDKSPAAGVMGDAIELAIEQRSPYPEKAAFIDADEPANGRADRRPKRRVTCSAWT